MYSQAVAFHAICMGYVVLTCTLKPIKKALTSFETGPYMNRGGVGPHLAKREQ